MKCKLLQFFLYSTLLIFISTFSYSQLQGTYTINAAVATGGTNFQSFTALANALNTQTVINPVTINVVANSGPYNEMFIVNNINGTSATNRVTINGNNNIIQFNNDAINTRIIALNGTRYLSIKNLTIKSLNNTYGWGIHFAANAMFDSIINCKINLESINVGQDHTSAGIVISNSTVNTNGVNSYGENASNIYIGNNEIFGVTTSQSGYMAGIYINGKMNNNIISGASNIVIKNNIIKNFFRFGIVTRYDNKTIIDGNDIHRIDKQGVPNNSVLGIQSQDVDQILIANNRIHDPNSDGNASNFGYTGIQIINFANDNDPNKNSYIFNNAFYNNSTFGGATSYIKISGNTLNDYYILHNTIDVSKTIGNGAQNLCGIEILEDGQNSFVQNNIVSITGGNSGTKVGLKYHETFDIKKIKNNNIYVNSSQPGSTFYAQFSNVGFFNYATFALAQAAGFAAGQFSADPLFTNAATGNLLPTNNQLFQAGTQWINPVSKDIIGINRNIIPTIGAWEMSSNVAIDAGVASLVSPINNCQSNQPITVRVGNFTNNLINSVTITTYINNIAQPNLIYTTPIPANGYADITTMNYNFLPNTNYNIKIEISNINNATDGNISNNIYETTYRLGLSGNYTINQTMPAAGNNYQSFSSLANDLNKFGVCSAVIVNVDPTVDIVDNFYLDSIIGTSATNTITINGNNAKINFNTTQENPSAIILDNTQFTTINDLQIFVNGDSVALGILLCNGAKNDTINNNTIEINSNNNNYYYSYNFGRQGGISVLTHRYNSYYNSSNYYYKHIENIQISKNKISGNNSDSVEFQSGIFVYGNYYNNIIDGNSFKNINAVDNSVINFGSYGIYYYNVMNSVIEYNNIEKPAIDSFNFNYYYTMGLFTSVCENVNIMGNIIHNIEVDSNNNTGNGFYGIYAVNHNVYNNGSSVIANNAIFNIRHRNFNNNYINHDLYLYATNFSNIKFYHNTLDVDSIHDSWTNINSLVYLSPSTNDVSSEFKNNLIKINKVISQNNYSAIRIISATSNLLNGNMQKNNIYLNPASPTPINWAIIGAVSYPNLAAFQAAYPTNEIGSTEEDPLYYDYANNDLTPTNPLVLNSGVNLQSIVPQDIVKNNRPTNPTVGAYEMNPEDYNNAGVLTLNSPLGNFCSGYRSVQCKIYNAGKNNINVVTVNWSVNNVLQPPVVYNGTMFGSTSGNSNTSANITLGTAYIPFGFPSEIKIWTSNPNNTQDLYNQNDTLIAYVEPTNTIAVNLFGNDTTICEGYNYSLVAGNPTQLQYTYLWDNNSNAAIRPITAPGIYWVIKTDNTNNCSAHDSIEIKFNPTPEVNLGADEGLCIGDTIQLFVGNDNLPYNKLWNDNDTSSYKIVTQPGTYYVEVTNNFGCMGSDEIVIEDKEVPEVDGINAVYMLDAVYNFSLQNPKYVLMAIWDFGDGSPVDTGFLVTHKYQKNGYYNVTVKLLSTCANGGYVLHTETLDAIGLGTEDINTKFHVKVYPNPATEAITIEVKNNLVIKGINIFNATGQRVYSNQLINEYSVNISTQKFAGGLYMVEIITDFGKEWIKFEIVK